MRSRLLNVFAALTVAATVAACGGDSTAPQSTVAGSYTASEFITTGGSGQTNQLLSGSTVQITLNSDGTTTGHMHLAASGGTPAGDYDLAGTWHQNGTTVGFTQAVDTFIRNMVFTIQPIAAGVWNLIGDQAFSGTRVQLTLRHG